MSQLDTTLQLDTMTSDSISPNITSTLAIPAISAQNSTVNVAGGNQTNITNIYNVDPNCNQGIGLINHTTSTELIIYLDKIYQWLSAFIPSGNYYGGLDVRLEDTGLWFINGERFARWKATADDFIWICGTRMYFHRLRITISFELVWQLVQARPSCGESPP
jgi:hypothetical protein